MPAMNTTQENKIPEDENGLSFSSLPLREELLNNLFSLNYTAMTPVQAQSLPMILNHKNVIAQAQTGSGKTVAFGLAILNRLDIEQLVPQAIVLCPTRELAEQVSQVIRRLARFLPNVKILNISGGMPMKPQLDSLKHGAHIIVGTPGRIQKHLDKETLSLRKLQILVLDEADKMLDMGFYDALKHIVAFCPAQRQTLLFSATFAAQIQQLAKDFLQNPIEINVKDETSSLDIEQKFFEVLNHNDKYPLLKKLLFHYNPSSTLIFCNTKENTKELSSQLRQDGFSTIVLNGDLEQTERDQAMIQFSNQSCSILVATDVAARGLDIKELPVIINFDLAFDDEVHTHRIGRTGRAGCKGIALSLTLPNDAERLCILEQLMAHPLTWGAIHELENPKTAMVLPPPMITLRLTSGRKDKIRPGDILGALTKDAGLPSEVIGKIDISALHSFVAIKRSHLGKAFEHFQKGKLKGRKVGVQRLS
jgi:ATP-independent RNA helicase DbpA